MDLKLFAAMEPIFFTPPRTRDQRCLFKGGGPAPPDPYTTADAQSKANLEALQKSAEINRYDQKTPFGTTKWTQGTGTTFDEAGYNKALQDYQAGNWTPTATNFDSKAYLAANPDVAASAKYKDNAFQHYVDYGKSEGRGGVQTIGPTKEMFTTIQNPDKWSNEVNLDPKLQNLVDSYYAQTQQPQKQVDFSKLPEVYNAGKTGEDYRATAGKDISFNGDAVGQSGQIAGSSGELMAGQVDRLKKLYGTEFNFDKAPAMPTGDEAMRKKVEDAYYQRYSARLDPRFANEEAEMRSRLANQGITEDSEAYNRELDNWRRGKNDAYSSAINDSVINSTSEMKKLFDMGLAARQQGVSEQKYLRELPTSEALAAQGLYSGNSQVHNQNLETQMAQQRLAMELAERQQAMDDATRVQSEQTRAGRLQEALLDKQLQTGDRTQGLNELTALVTGTQVQAPGGNVGPMQAAPVAQSIYNSYQGDVANYNAKVGQQNALIGAAGNVAGMSAMAFF